MCMGWGSVGQGRVSWGCEGGTNNRWTFERQQDGALSPGSHLRVHLTSLSKIAAPLRVERQDKR